MANNERFLLKQFSGEANNNGVFGSYESDNATISNDPETLQSLSAYETGWEDATTSGAKLPRLEEMQGLQYLFCKAIKELYSEGIPFWMAGETYYLGSVCMYFDENNDFALYRNISGTNGSNIPPVDTVNWVKLVTDGAEKDLSNLTSQGKNIANWSSNISNCITEIPQDIKLELNNGTLTLKAGSKLYVPNGAGVFDTVTITSDLTSTFTSSSNQRMFFWNSTGNYIQSEQLANIYSGSAVPTGSGTIYWFDTTNGLIKRSTDGGSTWGTDKYSLSLGLFSVSNNTISSIDQVFNGIGYIGNKLFVLPGFKGLIPYYWNKNGTYKSISFETTEVLVLADNLEVASKTNEGIRLSSSEIARGVLYYNKDLNINTPSSSDPNSFRGFINVGTFSTDVNKKITALNVNTPFHAVDYNELGDYIVSYQLPTAENGYVYYFKYASGVVKEGVHNPNRLAFTSTVSIASQAGMEIINKFTLPIPLKSIISANAELTGDSGVYCGDVFRLGTTVASCYVFNNNTYNVDSDVLKVYFDIVGEKA